MFPALHIQYKKIKQNVSLIIFILIARQSDILGVLVKYDILWKLIRSTFFLDFKRGYFRAKEMAQWTQT